VQFENIELFPQRDALLLLFLKLAREKVADVDGFLSLFFKGLG